MIELAALSMLAGGFDRLEDATVEAHGVTARAKRNPIQIHGCCGRSPHGGIEVSSAGLAADIRNQPYGAWGNVRSLGQSVSARGAYD